MIPFRPQRQQQLAGKAGAMDKAGAKGKAGAKDVKGGRKGVAQPTAVDKDIVADDDAEFEDAGGGRGLQLSDVGDPGNASSGRGQLIQVFVFSATLTLPAELRRRMKQGKALFKQCQGRLKSMGRQWMAAD